MTFWDQNASKIYAKIDAKFDTETNENRCPNVPKMIPTLVQTRCKNQGRRENIFFDKKRTPCGPQHDFEGSGVRQITKNPIGNRLKDVSEKRMQKNMTNKPKCIQNGSQHRPKWEPKVDGKIDPKF